MHHITAYRKPKRKKNNSCRHMMKTKKKTQQYLPHELIIQILLRLPVKSLLRFKRVCKLWLTLISDTHFANSHFQITAAAHSPTMLLLSNSAATHETSLDQSRSERSADSDSDTHFANSHFQLATEPPTHTIQLVSHPYLLTPSIDFQESVNPHSASASLGLNFTPFQSYSHIQIIGSCRGFILLHCHCQHMLNNIYIFNPSTGVHKKLPLSPFDKLTCYLYGFGYDRSTDDYLVVSMSFEYDTTIDNTSSHLEFFSLRDNTWKEIEGTHFPYMNSSILSYVHSNAGLLYNGVIHWLAFRHDLKRYVIVTFDLMERKLEEMHLPDDFYFVYDPCTYGLWVFGEFLSVWAPWYDTLEIWVMKEYKMHSSWTKIVLLTDGLSDEYFVPLCSTKNGDIIGTDGDTGWVKLKYNDKGHLLDHSYCNYPHGSQATMYIESLFSLPADNEQAQEVDTNKKKNEVVKYSPSLFS